MRRFERAGIAVVVALLILLPVAVHGWPASVAGNVFTIPGICWNSSAWAFIRPSRTAVQ